MQHRPALTGEIAEQRERDGALSAARAARHHEDPLGIRGARTLHVVQRQVNRQTLIAQQVEHLALANLLSCHR